MKIEMIYEAIDRYADERMKAGKKLAAEHFLAYVYLKNSRDEILEFMKKAGGLSRYYISFLRVMENPFKGPEFAWLSSMLTIGVFSSYLICTDDSSILGIVMLSGTLVYAWSLVKMVAKKWLDIGVMIAIYNEIVELVENETKSAV
jgi:hypothetical protein